MHVCEQEVITTSMNKKLKKLTAILLTVCLAFALCACSSGGSGTSQGTGQAQPAGGGQTTEAVQETVPAADHQAQQAETAAQTAEAGAEAANTAAEAADTAVSQTSSTSAAASDTASPAQQSEKIDYLALVNKLNPLPEGWEDALETVHMTNSIGDDVEVEKKAYDAYLLWDRYAQLSADGDGVLGVFVRERQHAARFGEGLQPRGDFGLVILGFALPRHKAAERTAEFPDAPFERRAAYP